MDEDIVIPLAGMMMIIIISVGIPLVIALSKKWERQAGRPQVPADVALRLERIEQAVDSIALEVERISEGQRFTTRLLADRAETKVPAPVERPR
jgi:hypothetical protein